MNLHSSLIRPPAGVLALPLLFVLCDFPAWWSLIERGIAPDDAEAVLVRLVLTEVDRIGLDDDRPAAGRLDRRQPH